MPFQRPKKSAALVCSVNKFDSINIEPINSNQFVLLPKCGARTVRASIADLEAMLAWCKEQVR